MNKNKYVDWLEENESDLREKYIKGRNMEDDFYDFCIQEFADKDVEPEFEQELNTELDERMGMLKIKDNTGIDLKTKYTSQGGF
jgi:hypothetical protein